MGRCTMLDPSPVLEQLLCQPVEQALINFENPAQVSVLLKIPYTDLLQKGCAKRCYLKYLPHYSAPFLCSNIQIRLNKVLFES